MAAAIGETLSPPRTDRPFALDQTKTRTSTPVEVLNVSVCDNPEGVPDHPPFARRPTVFSAVRPQHGLRDGRSSKRFATTRHSRPRSTPCGRGREPEPRDRFICIRQIAPSDTSRSEAPANRGVGEMSAAAPLRVRGSSPKAKTRQGLQKPPQAARRARPEGRRPNLPKRRSELQRKKWRSLVVMMTRSNDAHRTAYDAGPADDDSHP